MSLTSGTRLGPYEIVAQIGAGGMGEVYKATDTRLNRTIAIKVLPEHLATDPQRLARFQREAQTISSLNHPHICALHDVGDENGTHFLVMEFVEGEALDQRLEKGPVPLDDALEYAKQIAEALEKAHQQGIVHRDLKPANVMITKSGVKLLDFGLAKLTGDSGSSPPLSQLDTQDDSGLTAEGTIMGTFRYMAPEQVEGKDVDALTDIYALCLVIYEMITGKRAIDGDTQASLIAAILKDKPTPITELQPITPPQLDRVVQTGLEKDPEKRWQSAREVRHALEWIGLESLSGEPVERVRASGRWKVAAVALAVVVAAMALVILRPEATEPRPVSRFVLNTPPEGTVSSLLIGNTVQDTALVAISPDGRSIVYQTGDAVATTRRLYLRRLGDLEATPLEGTEGAYGAFFSPDGQAIGFSDGVDGLRRISVLGGPPRPVMGGISGLSFRGASWGSDDRIVFATRGSGLMRVDAAGGDVDSLTTLDPASGETGHQWPEVLPNGRGVLFTRTFASGLHRLAVYSDGTPTRDLWEGGTHPRYSPTGHIVFNVEGELWALGFDAERLELTTETAVPLEVTTSSGQFDLASEEGSLVYLNAGLPQDSMVWVNRQGVETPLDFPEGAYRNPRISPDGTRLLVGTSGEGSFVSELTRPSFRQLTGAPGNWIDNETRVFGGVQNGETGIFSQVVGTDETQVLATIPGSEFVSPEGASPDGHIAFAYIVPTTGFNIGVKPPGDEMWYPLLDGEEAEEVVTLSPDGELMAYESDRSGAMEIWVERFPNGGEREQVSFTGGVNAEWSPSGDELFYQRLLDGAMMVSVIRRQPRLTASEPVVAFPGEGYRFGSGKHYDVHPDGRFLMLKESVGATREIVFSENFSTELNRLIPLDD